MVTPAGRLLPGEARARAIRSAEAGLDRLATRPASRWRWARALLSMEDMPTKIRINLANEQELTELPGIGAPEAANIHPFPSAHRPEPGAGSRLPHAPGREKAQLDPTP